MNSVRLRRPVKSRSHCLYSLYKASQPFHLVEYSPWPLLRGFTIMSMPVALIRVIKRKDVVPFFLTTALIALIAGIWWRDVSRESTYQGHHNTFVVDGMKIGMLLFIVREVLFFFSFFWAFFHSSLAPTAEIGIVCLLYGTCFIIGLKSTRVWYVCWVLGMKVVTEPKMFKNILGTAFIVHCLSSCSKISDSPLDFSFCNQSSHSLIWVDSIMSRSLSTLSIFLVRKLEMNIFNHFNGWHQSGNCVQWKRWLHDAWF